MIYFLLFLAEIIIVFLLSKRVQKAISLLLIKITKNKNLTIYMMAFLFFPGTFIHEVSHFLFALFLLVPVGNMHLIPVIEEDGIRLGSVSIAKTDPIRRFIIGAAPLFVGVSIIFAIIYYFSSTDLLTYWVIDLCILYAVFTISNSMFSSKKDMEGLSVFVVIVLAFCATFWFLGVKIDLSGFFEKFTEIFKSASIFMTIPILINVLVLSLLPKRT